MGKLIRVFVVLALLGGAGYGAYYYSAQAHAKATAPPGGKSGRPAERKPGEPAVPVEEKYGFTSDPLAH